MKLYTEKELVSFANYCLASDAVKNRKFDGQPIFVSHAAFSNWQSETIDYTKKPVAIQAIQYTGLNGDDILAFGGEFVQECETLNPTEKNPMGCFFTVDTGFGFIVGIVGDYLIKGVEGEYYTCKASIFEKTYNKN